MTHTANPTVVIGEIAMSVPYASTTSTLKRLSSYEDGYNLYEVTVNHDYNIDELIGESARNDQSFADSISRQFFPNLSIKMKAPFFGCSAFRAYANGVVLTGRNYDFKEDSSALLVRTHPKDGYAAIAFACLNNLGENVPDKDDESKLVSVFAPFASLDGLNEKGVSISVLTLDSEPVNQQTGKPAINTALAIRMVLDRASTTQEAIDILASYDMHAAAGRDYHFFINDAIGTSVVVEYDLRDPGRRIIVTPAREITNYYAAYADEVKPNQHNVNLGHGKERALAIADVFNANGKGMSREAAWDALRASSQDPNPEDITSNTQWSVLYDNTNLTAEIVLRRHWGDAFSFTLE